MTKFGSNIAPTISALSQELEEVLEGFALQMGQGDPTRLFEVCEQLRKLGDITGETISTRDQSPD